MTPAATVLITTRNRAGELMRAVESALAQTADCEVLVIDDGSADGTADELARRFPAVRCVRHAESAGYIVRRNQGAALAKAPIVVSIDDDAIFPSRTTVAATLDAFDHPRVGAVTIPFVDVHKSPSVRQAAPTADGVWVAADYVGTAHALRRDLFLRLGGYRPVLFHQGEERDYCLRMLAAGYVTRLGIGDPIHHLESPRRDFRRMDLYGRRNDVLFAYHNVPAPEIWGHLAATAFKGLCFGFRCGKPIIMARGLWMGVQAAAADRAARRTVGRRIYWLHRRLKKAGATPLRAIESLLPPAVELLTSVV